jgi:hypothetical protein
MNLVIIGVKELKSYFLLIALIKNKYLLYNINVMKIS